MGDGTGQGRDRNSFGRERVSAERLTMFHPSSRLV